MDSHIEVGRQLWIRVTPEAWQRTHKALRDDAGFHFFEFLSAIDWMPSPFGKSEDATADAGVSVTPSPNRARSSPATPVARPGSRSSPAW